MKRLVLGLCLLAATPVSARVISIQTTAGRWVDIEVRSVRAAGEAVAFVVPAYTVRLEPDTQAGAASFTPAPHKLSVEDEGPCLQVESMDGKVADTSASGAYVYYGWVTTVNNRCGNSIRALVKFSILDGDIPLDSDSEWLTIPAKSGATARGRMMTKASTFSRMTQNHVSVRVR